MKGIILIITFFFCFSAFFPNIVSAAAFSGRIIITIPNIICTSGQSPFFIIPAGKSSPKGPYGAVVPTLHIIKTLKSIVGSYAPIMAPVCATTTIPPVPFFVYPITVFGVSK